MGPSFSIFYIALSTFLNIAMLNEIYKLSQDLHRMYGNHTESGLSACLWVVPGQEGRVSHDVAWYLSQGVTEFTIFVDDPSKFASFKNMWYNVGLPIDFHNRTTYQRDMADCLVNKVVDSSKRTVLTGSIHGGPPVDLTVGTMDPPCSQLDNSTKILYLGRSTHDRLTQLNNVRKGFECKGAPPARTHPIPSMYSVPTLNPH